jgi:solute carrier family 25 carnitine/acylcarnitine transporter 20/29
MELVKIRMQLNESSISSPWEVLKSIYRTEGGFRRGIFKGWALTVSREIPGFGSYFASYEALISHFEGYECLTSKGERDSQRSTQLVAT